MKRILLATLLVTGASAACSDGGNNDGEAVSALPPGAPVGAGGQVSTANGSGGAGSGGEAGTCVDEPVPGDMYTCTQQAGWGKCGEPWMAGYCNLTCARCGDPVGAECGPVGAPADLNVAPGTAPETDCAAAPADACPFGGLTHACKDRFALGVNYAWRDFGTDFGGLAAWNLSGISGNVEVYDQDLANMKANGAGVVRWWMFPDLRGDGVTKDAAGSPTGITPATVTDIQLALELAQRHDIYLVPTLFSFDAFRATRMEGDIEIPGISHLVESEAGRAALVANIVVPVAQAVAASPYASRLLAWDVINEPEWAIRPTGTAPSGGEFTPNSAELTPVSLADMKAFINASLSALGTETPATLRSVGWAAAKWAWAFTDVVEVEFHQPHIYSWVNDFWPYTTAPAELGYTPDLPVVMGEYYLLDGPFGSMPTFETVMNSWYDNGYAGAWSWQYFDGCISKPGAQGLDMTLIGKFAEAKGCSVSF